ncbi:MAG: CPBP family intramembrane metalloprotease [Bacteroidaceae bacterium]|nr:CPBP family intramembrane metalloprotease [Bacteroidaceae bacterium]
MNKKTSTQIFSLLGLVILFYLLTITAAFILQYKGVEMWRFLMATTALQNIGIFIIPAVITARIFNPGKTLQVMQIDRMPGLAHIGLMILIYMASIPTMSAIVQWNEGLQLPESLSWMRDMEEAAKQATEQLMNISSIGQLITVILIVGVLTGVGEEFLFRGSLQRLMIERNINIHAAVWVTAFIFSAIHMQAFGFVPRMLLGALFGYMVVWSGSLWLAVLAHALNNSLTTLTYYYPSLENAPWIGTEPTTITIIVSAIATLALTFVYYKWVRIKD